MIIRLLLLLAVLSAGCTAAPQRSEVVDSPVVPFSELFTPADTIRLDSSVIIGAITFLDVNQEGSLLVTDRAGRSINLFSSSGKHVRTYSTRECLPDDEGLLPYSARFLGSDRLVTKHSGGAVVVFTADGHCVGATRSLPVFSSGFCVGGDSLFFLVSPLPSGEAKSHNAVEVFSPELRRLGSIPLAWPGFPALNVNFGGIFERNIDCFADGPYFTYLGAMDAIPVRPEGRPARQRPEFYSERPRDLSRNMSREERRAEWNKYLTTDAVFALTSHTRMVVYRNLDDRWQPAGTEDHQVSFGIGVASNDGRFPPRSTIVSFWPSATGYGYVYSAGDHALLSDGDVGNPLILRYRFVQPQTTDD